MKPPHWRQDTPREQAIAITAAIKGWLHNVQTGVSTPERGIPAALQMLSELEALQAGWLKANWESGTLFNESWKISVARDFTRFPAGRKREDSEWSGQRFQEDFLMPAFQNWAVVVVDLDGTFGYGSNWLQGAFGDLSKKLRLSPAILSHSLQIVSEDPSLIQEVRSYL